MTGYGRAEGSLGSLSITAEAKSLNGRHLDIKTRLSQELNPLEITVRRIIQERFSRGTVILSIQIQESSKTVPGLNASAARQMVQNLRRLKKELKLPGEVDLEVLTRFPQISRTPSDEIGTDALWLKVEKILKKALDDLGKSRHREGTSLKKAIKEHLDQLSDRARMIGQEHPRALRELKGKVKEKILRWAGGDVVDGRKLEEELAFVITRRDFTEELNRLKAHVSSLRKVINNKGPIGRNLEFLCQEVLRELTTIASKSPGKDISQMTIDARVELEKIREQVYNVE